MLGSSSEEEKKETREREDIFEPEIVCVHSYSGDASVTCPRCLQSIADPYNHRRLPPTTTTTPSRTDYPVSDEEDEIEKENEKVEEEEVDAADKNDDDLARSGDISSNLRFIFHLDGLKESGGLLYIGCECDKEKTNPSKILEWFSTEFLNLHRVYAIREEEPFLLKVFTRNHEITNRGIRKKGGRKVMLMGKEVFGDVLLACGRCGYWSREGSNVRRHLKKSVCLKERGYCKEQLAGLDRTERRRFLRRVAAAKCRAKKKARALSEGADGEAVVEDSTPPGTISVAVTTTTATAISTSTSTTTSNNTNTTNTFTATSTTTSYPSCPLVSSEEPYAECLVEIEETCYPGNEGKGARISATPRQQQQQQQPKKRQVRHKALMLGPEVVREAVVRVPYDIFTVNENNERVAWKPPQCHKISPGELPCQIVFKGARTKRRCLDVPLPRVLIYRKLDCKAHHCNFTLFHPSARAAFHCDSSAKSSIDIKMYGDIVMTQDFYHYFVSLLSIMKMKFSQTARHLTSVWETILAERLGTSTIPEEYRKIITLSKDTVKTVWSSIEEAAENKGGIKPSKGFRRRKKRPPVLSSSVSLPPPLPLPPSSVASFPSTMDTCGVVQPSSAHPCVKRLNPIAKPPPLPPPPPPPTHPPPSTHAAPVPPKPSMMPLPPPHPPHPHPPHHNSLQQAPTHTAVNHTHWLGQAPQYPHNMTPYSMAPHPPSADYYSVPGHFMTQYTPATMGTST